MCDKNLIQSLDFHLQRVLAKPNDVDLERFFYFLRRCHETSSITDDQLYVPTIFLLRQFEKFAQAKLFDQLFDEFRRFFALIPICSKKILDDFLCLISVILAKKIVESRDEIQQENFLRFFHSFIRSSKTRGEIFGDLNRNLPMIGHFFSSFLQIFERVKSLECRLEILDTFSTLISTENVDEIVASFLPGILKSLAQNLGRVHRRLAVSNLRFLTEILRLAVRRAEKIFPSDLIVERNDFWLDVVDSHLPNILQNFAEKFLNDENVEVRRAFGQFVLLIVEEKSTLLKNSGRIATKLFFICVSKKIFLPDENFRLTDENFFACQKDFLAMLDENENERKFSLAQRRARLDFAIGFFRLGQIFTSDFFYEKIFKFLIENLDLDVSLPHGENFRSDVEEQLDEFIKIYLRTNENFVEFLFDELRRRTTKNVEKIFYLISIVFKEEKFDRDDDFRFLLKFFDDQRRVDVKKIFFLLQTLRTVTRRDHFEYFVDYLPFLLRLCHFSTDEILRQSAFFSLKKLDENLPEFLVENSQKIVDRALRKVRTSSRDGFIILIEFVRLGKTSTVNLPIMTHVIEEFLLELSSLPSSETVQLTFEFLANFSQQIDVTKTSNRTEKTSFVDFVENFHRKSVGEKLDEEEKNENSPWKKMIVSIVDVFQHFISNGDVRIRAVVLDALPALTRVLSTFDENSFLPLIHKIWPGFVQRFYDVDLNIRIRCLTTLELFSQLCSDFLDRRIQNEILPIFLQQLERNRTISSSHSLDFRYAKTFLTKLAPILNVITVQFDQIEQIILQLFLYLQNELFASFAAEQLKILCEKYADEIWLMLILHDENEFKREDFPQMKVYKAQPRLTLDPKWKSSLIDRLNRC